MRRVARQFFVQMGFLLLLYGGVALLTAMKFLGPDPLAQSFPFHQASALANVLLQLAIASGLLGGGGWLIAESSDPGVSLSTTLYIWAGRLWTVLLVVALLAGLLGLLDGRSLLELPPLLAALQVIVMLMVLASAALQPYRWSGALLVWTISLALAAAGVLVGLLPAVDFIQDRTLRTISTQLTANIAFILGGLALAYARLNQDASEARFFVPCGLLALGGGLASLSPFMITGAPGWMLVLGTASVILIPLCYLLALSLLAPLWAQNSTTQRWLALGLLLAFLGPGMLGGLQAAPQVAIWTMGTRLTDLQHTLALLAAVALILGALPPRRPVGPNWGFWFSAVGVLGGAAALAGAGLVQVYLERVLSIGYLDTQTLLIPLYMLWVFFWLWVIVGFALFCFDFWRRRE